MRGCAFGISVVKGWGDDHTLSVDGGGLRTDIRAEDGRLSFRTCQCDFGFVFDIGNRYGDVYYRSDHSA